MFLFVVKGKVVRLLMLLWVAGNNNYLKVMIFTEFVCLLNAGTPFWKLVVKQFDDLLVKILIVAALVSFVLALINGDTGLTAFLEPSVRGSCLVYFNICMYFLV